MIKDDLKKRLSVRTEERDAAASRADRLGNVRLVLAAIGLFLILLPLFTKDGMPWLGLIPLGLAFVVIGKMQDVTFDRRRQRSGAVRFFEGSILRLEEGWRELENTGRDFGESLPPEHYAQDLDLFGKASLFQLLDRALTRKGSRTLADWLLTPASIEEAKRRQASVQELVGKLDFTESLHMAAAGDEVGPLDHQKLLEWGEEDARLPMEGFLRLLGILHPLVLFGTLAYHLAGGSRAPLVIAIIVQVISVFATRRVTEPRASMLSGPERVLGRFARLIAAIEAEQLSSPSLSRVKEALGKQGQASERIHALTKLVNMLDARLNMFFALSIGPALMWDLNIVLRAEKWRREIGPSLRGWFEAIGELEALASLACFARERPDYTPPELLPEGCQFEAEALAHPLIQRDQVVANDLTLGGEGSLLLLSGSNMSGKSTLLRSVGINVVLARSGSVVAARSLELSDVHLATSVRVVDSLAHGTSHFYAELARLKHIVDVTASSQRPVLYLLDEVLHGTNSRERYIGAVSVIKWLAQAGAMGIVTTHDLSLSRVAEELPEGKATNRHFSDDIVDDKMYFDYRLRDGPVASTNALRLMKHIGIDVEYVEG